MDSAAFSMADRCNYCLKYKDEYKGKKVTEEREFISEYLKTNPNASMVEVYSLIAKNYIP